MLIFHGSHTFPQDRTGISVALGNFDGVHHGHRAVIAKAIVEAKHLKTRSAIYTFEPHPVKVLAPALCPRMIQTLAQRLSSFEELGVDFCVIEHFTKEFASLRAEQFFSDIIVAKLHAKALVAGYDFTFGRHRLGNTQTLTTLCASHGIHCTIVDAQFSNDTLMSSTTIRRMIEGGQVREASVLLGRPYTLRGKVVSGRKRGKTLGAPTANLESENEIIPREGVYLTLCKILSSSKAIFPAITSIGRNPTFAEHHLSIETHLIDREIDLMGKEIEVFFLEWMRAQITFDSAKDLAAQITADSASARAMHGSRQTAGKGQL